MNKIWQKRFAPSGAAADVRHFFGLVSEQHRYHLLCRLPELEVFPAARNMGIGVMAYSPLAGGLLSGRALNPEQGSRGAQERGAAELYRVKLEAFGVLCRELGESEANVALAWTLAHPAVNCVVIGPRKVEQVTNALRAVEIALDDGTMARLNELFPGPGGEAPEAYAW